MLVDLSLKAKDASSDGNHLKGDHGGEQATDATKTRKHVVVELGGPQGRKRRPEHGDGDNVEVTVSWKGTSASANIFLAAKKSKLSKSL